MSEIPRVKATAEQDGGKWWLTVSACPHCGRKHQHGAGVIVRGHDAPIPSMWREVGAPCFKGRYVMVKEAGDGDVR